MADPHVVTALCRKRAELSGYIAELERKIARERVNLAHIDAAIRMFSPDTDPASIAAKRTYRRNRYFSRHEVSRRCYDALRTATGKPLLATDIAKTILADKALATDDAKLVAVVTEIVLASLSRLQRRGKIARTGAGRNTQWALPPSLL
jgi:hypothetical protein